jgi:antitoxin (DNA-binding transcriptional repressor) of toxin-antitoxin stability system
MEDLETGRDPGGNTDFGQYVLAAIRAAEAGCWFRVTLHGRAIAMIVPPEEGEAVRRDAGYWDEVERAVGTGTLSLLLGTSTRSLRKNLARLRKVTEENP